MDPSGHSLIRLAAGAMPLALTGKIGACRWSAAPEPGES